MRYDLNLLPIFVALMEEHSVTRAAERLGMTQPALSNALARLRLLLQDPLFIRERYGIQPTPVALELAPAIADALARLDDAVLGQQDFDPATAERLFTIAPNGYVEFALMPAIVAKLAAVAPGIKLRLTPYGNDLTETGVVSGTTAMVIGRISVALKSQFERRPPISSKSLIATPFDPARRKTESAPKVHCHQLK